MRAYASRTGTRKNLEELRRRDWRLLVSAKGKLSHEGFPYAIDNGAWTAHQRGEAFDVAAFEKALQWGAADADWVILPDIVAGGYASLRMSLEWLKRLQGLCPFLLAVQDGMMVEDIRPLIGCELGVALGGSTEFKEQTMSMWGKLCRERSAYFHVLRVNTCRRIDLCRDAGADSFDGSGPSRFFNCIALLDGARRQTSLLGAL